jgi:hypothetical protein
MNRIISMKIATKIGIGFGLLTLALIINALLINNVLNKSRKLNQQISAVYQPSEGMLIRMHDLISNSQMLIKSWVFIDKVANTPDKMRLTEFHNTVFPELKRDLFKITDQWDDNDRIECEKICIQITDTLFRLHHTIMDQLTNIEQYNDPSVMFNIIPLISDKGEIITRTSSILQGLKIMIKHQQEKVLAARFEMDHSLKSLKNFIIFTCIFLVISSLLLAFFTARSLVVPIEYIKGILLSMSKGILPNEKIEERGDEIGEMSRALNELVTGLKAISGFALEIGRGNYDNKFKPLSNKDVLGNSLLRMRDDLKTASIEEAKRKLEDEQRNWATTGIARFSEILRQNNDKLEALSFNIISNLVKYLNTNQGGIFIINNNDSSDIFIELVACYAYNRQKFLEKRISMGEGLLGRCIQEKETIYLTDIPQGYVKINSGMGDSTPRSLLIVPLEMNNEVFGAIEIASFQEIQKYQIEFVEKIAESIASTLSAVKINMQTTKLLEQSRVQTEEMAAQEEEMRQNMEELRATQEQSERKEHDLKVALEDLQQKINPH